jgi:multiple sugar transport system ATP-binding protein
MTQLELKSLTKSFGAYKVFDGLNLAAEPGEIVVIFGGSGTGKTILLRLIAGVEEPTSGLIEIEGNDVADIAPEHRNVGMAFQNFALFPHMSAFENIATPLRAQNAAAGAVKAGVDKVAKLLKIDHVLGHAPRELSNGQKQRTALARALAAEPRILLLDDPLRNVDAKLRFEMRLELPRLLRQTGATVLYVTQDYKEAMALADRIAVIANGRFIQTATPEDIYLKPATLGVARLFGDPSINTVGTKIEMTGKMVNVTLGGVKVPIDNAYKQYDKRDVTFGVRPEAVEINASKDAGLMAKVMAVTPLNERTVLLLHSEGGWEFLASLPSSATNIPEPGAKVKATFVAAGTHLFDKTTAERLHG